MKRLNMNTKTHKQLREHTTACKHENNTETAQKRTINEPEPNTTTPIMSFILVFVFVGRLNTFGSVIPILCKKGIRRPKVSGVHF